MVPNAQGKWQKKHLCLGNQTEFGNFDKHSEFYMRGL